MWNPFRRQEQSPITQEGNDIDKINEKEHNTDKVSSEQNPEKMDFVKEIERRETQMVEAHRRKAKLAAAGYLGVSLLTAAPAFANGEGAAALRGLFGSLNKGMGEVGATIRQQQREDTRREQQVLNREIQEMREQTRRLQEELRRQRDEHRDDSYIKREEVRKDRDLGREHERTEQVKTREGSHVQREEIKETERSRRDLSKQGVYEMGHKTEDEGSFGRNRRERNSDAISIEQMRREGVSVKPMPNEKSERASEGGGYRELTPERCTELGERVVADYKKGEYDRDFYVSFTPQEREFYGHRWNLLERTVGKTNILLGADGPIEREDER